MLIRYDDVEIDKEMNKSMIDLPETAFHLYRAAQIVRPEVVLRHDCLKRRELHILLEWTRLNELHKHVWIDGCRRRAEMVKITMETRLAELPLTDAERTAARKRFCAAKSRELVNFLQKGRTFNPKMQPNLISYFTGTIFEHNSLIDALPLMPSTSKPHDRMKELKVFVKKAKKYFKENLVANSDALNVLLDAGCYCSELRVLSKFIELRQSLGMMYEPIAIVHNYDAVLSAARERRPKSGPAYPGAWKRRHPRFVKSTVFDHFFSIERYNHIKFYNSHSIAIRPDGVFGIVLNKWRTMTEEERNDWRDVYLKDFAAAHSMYKATLSIKDKDKYKRKVLKQIKHLPAIAKADAPSQVIMEPADVAAMGGFVPRAVWRYCPLLHWVDISHSRFSRCDTVEMQKCTVALLELATSGSHTAEEILVELRRISNVAAEFAALVFKDTAFKRVFQLILVENKSINRARIYSNFKNEYIEKESSDEEDLPTTSAASRIVEEKESAESNSDQELVDLGLLDTVIPKPKDSKPSILIDDDLETMMQSQPQLIEKPANLRKRRKKKTNDSGETIEMKRAKIVCKWCHKSFASTSSLIGHEYVCSMSTVCTVCGMQLPTAEQRAIHEDSWHEKEQETVLSCLLCGESFRTNNKLVIHRVFCT